MDQRLYISDEMLKSVLLAGEVSDLVAKVCGIETSPASAVKLRNLPTQWGTLEAVMYFNTEVNNGGHHQYFWNSRGYFIDLVKSGLNYFGANEHATIFLEATSRYDPARYEREQSERSTEAFQRAYKEEIYRDPDRRYYRSQPQLVNVVDDYIRKHISEFR